MKIVKYSLKKIKLTLCHSKIPDSANGRDKRLNDQEVSENHHRRYKNFTYFNLMDKKIVMYDKGNMSFCCCLKIQEIQSHLKI